MLVFSYGKESTEDVLKYPPLQFAFPNPAVSKQHCSQECLSVRRETIAQLQSKSHVLGFRRRRTGSDTAALLKHHQMSCIEGSM